MTLLPVASITNCRIFSFKAKEHLEEELKRRIPSQAVTSMKHDISSSNEDPKTNTLIRHNSDITNKHSRSPGGSNNSGGIPNVESPNETAETPTSEPMLTKHRPKKMLRKSASMISHSSATQRLKIGAPMQHVEKDTKGRS